MIRFFVVSVLLFLTSCKENTREKISEEAPIAEDVLTKNPQSSSLLDCTSVAPEWVELMRFQKELQHLSDQNIKSEKELEQLFVLLGKLKESVPKTYKTQSVVSRLIVMETDINMLNQMIADQDYTSAEQRKLSLLETYNTLIAFLGVLKVKSEDYERYK